MTSSSLMLRDALNNEGNLVKYRIKSLYDNMQYIAQVPFSSLNFGTDTSYECRLVIEQLLTATDEGLGNGETPIFPKYTWGVHWKLCM